MEHLHFLSENEDKDTIPKPYDHHNYLLSVVFSWAYRTIHTEVRRGYWFPEWVTPRLRRINEHHKSSQSLNIKSDLFIHCSILMLRAAGYAVHLELSHFQRIKP